MYFLEGEATVLTDAGEEKLLPGQVHYCPMGHSHSLINRGDCDLKFLAVVPVHQK
jgi:mannose-6-phosphate isomerase-like protein (cupin superfamily)